MLIGELLSNLSVLIFNRQLQSGSWQLVLNTPKIKCTDTVLGQLLKLECHVLLIQPTTNVCRCCIDRVTFEANLKNKPYSTTPEFANVIMTSINYCSSHFSVIKNKCIAALQLFVVSRHWTK